MKNKKRLLWVTNMPAPYRLPILDLLGTVYEVEVYFLLGQENWRNWPLREANRNWKSLFLNLKTFNVKDFELILTLGLGIRNVSNFDIIVLGSWENLYYLRLMRIAKKLNKVVVAIYESHVHSQKFKGGIVASIRKRFYRAASLVLTFGNPSTRAVKEMGIPDNLILELFNLVDNSWFLENVRHPKVTSEEGHSFLCVGRLISQKNIQAAIIAFAQVANSADKLRIAGSGSNYTYLRNLTKAMGVDHQVDFLGSLSQDELLTLYGHSQTLILPSKIEVWGLVVNEALACGLHVVVSSKAGVSHSVREHRGVYISSPEPEELAKYMAKSRSDWCGWISNPEIMLMSKENFVTEFVKRLDVEIERP
jgi:glycosyltransferase involved in cell wall biosynthesis